MNRAPRYGGLRLPPIGSPVYGEVSPWMSDAESASRELLRRLAAYYERHDWSPGRVYDTICQGNLRAMGDPAARPMGQRNRKKPAAIIVASAA